MDVREALDRLYSEPLDSFTKLRNQLASQLKDAGDAEGAAEIRSRKKPNLAAWALNQLARAYPEEVGELFEATDRLRQTHRRLVGGGKASGLREATADRAAVVQRLVKTAASLLEVGGHAASATTIAAINDSLLAVASDAEGAEELRAGTLTRELRSEAKVDPGPVRLVEQAPPRDDEPEDEPVTLKGAAALAELRDAVEDARRAKLAAERALEEAEDEAKRTAEAAEFAKRAVEARREEVDDAAIAVAEAEAALREAERG